MKQISIDEVKKMTNFEGLILQGGGDPYEWINGINKALTERGTLQKGNAIQPVAIFEYNGLINMLFNMDDVNKLAAWRLESRDTLKGIWLSDFLSDTFNLSKDKRMSKDEEIPIAAKPLQCCEEDVK